MCRAFTLVFLTVFLAACGAGSFKVDKEEYRQQVRTLGVVPLLVDGTAPLKHPQSREIVALMRNNSVGHHEALVAMLKEKKGYFDMRPVTGSAQGLLERLVRERTWQEGRHGLYHHYRYNPGAVAEIARRENVDALLVIILNGAVREERRWDRTRVRYLEAPYSSVLATAAVVLPTGEILWEHQGAESFLDLQYPAFDEAHHNLSDEVALHYVTLSGVERQFQVAGRRWLRDTELPQPYQKLFDRLRSELRPGRLNPFSATPASE